MKKSTKKRIKRNNVKYPALSREYNLKSRYDVIDYDYVDKLNPKEKEWLNSFTEEYVNANFNHEGKRIHPVEKKRKKIKQSGKMKTVDVYKNEAETRNNARNRCIVTRAKASGRLVELDEFYDKPKKK